MNAEEFIRVIIQVVRDAAIEDTIKSLKSPVGRHPSKNKVDLQEWFTSLSEADTIRLSQVITEAVDNSLFGFLAVIDGVRAIENGPKGELSFTYKAPSGKEVLLNDHYQEDLHDIYNGLTRECDLDD